MPTFANERENDDLRKLEGGAFYLGVRRYKESLENAAEDFEILLQNSCMIECIFIFKDLFR